MASRAQNLHAPLRASDEETTRYDHARLEGRRRVLRWMIEALAFRLLVKVDGVEGIENLPAQGAALVMINHIAFVDPVVVMGVLPRNVVPMAKIEAFRIPVFGIFPYLWDAIPVRRGEGDRAALRRATDVLRAGEVVLVAPEGTRGPTLGPGKEGVAFLASRAGALVVPTALEGTEGFPSISPRRWRQPGATVRLGRPFRFKSTGKRPGRDDLRAMTDEAMYALARMLPERRRGQYSDLSKATTHWLEFA
ncbi:MAG TPA: lysophospholipid acyltransferase family protein [Anaerolineales bacterium]|nr:lysophospholipid acyltransferase family protein [Anaerolineales bacterium]